MSGVILCIFARAPVKGRVKSRLARELGADGALAAHEALVADTLGRLAAVEGVSSELWVDDADHPGTLAWARRWRLPLRRQRGADLGERMCLALQHCLDADAWGIVVGTDCPAIDGAYVRRAVAALENRDVVLGPAADGGYGLVAARRAVPEIFHGIPWGSAAVLDATLAAAAAAGLTVSTLEQIWDVDTATDWRRYLALRGRG